MAKGFFYGSLLLFGISLLVTISFKGFKARHLFLWIGYSLYSVVFELVFSEMLHLYYYIYPSQSIFYILLASLFLYPAAAVLYVYYLPKGKVLWYTAMWIIVMQIIEIITVYTGTLVLTGWRIIPWSPVTYILSYQVIYMVNIYLKKLLHDSSLDAYSTK